MNVALIGTGYWGQIYIKTLKNIDDVNLYTYTYDYKKALKNKNIDCVIIATPAKTHYEIAKNCLLANKPILIEKPFTENYQEAYELYELSKKMDKILLVGHVYLHHPGIIKLKELIKNNYLGDIKEFNTSRLNISKYKNAILEIMYHDIYILDYFFDNDNIKNINSFGSLESCHAIIKYKNNINAFLYSNSNYPIKTRNMILEGSKGIALYDDTTINIIKNNNELENIKLDFSISPLEKQCKHFFDCILNKNKPIVNAYNGYKNISILNRIAELI